MKFMVLYQFSFRRVLKIAEIHFASGSRLVKCLEILDHFFCVSTHVMGLGTYARKCSGTTWLCICSKRPQCGGMIYPIIFLLHPFLYNSYPTRFLQVPTIGRQWFSSTLLNESFYSEAIASSRTFCIYEEVIFSFHIFFLFFSPFIYEFATELLT